MELVILWSQGLLNLIDMIKLKLLALSNFSLQVVILDFFRGLGLLSNREVRCSEFIKLNRFVLLIHLLDRHILRG